ncbi:HET-domain-containing protein, partial [Polyplosphaeria fusca]
MRLVDANTHKVREFIDDDNIPKFAILSHTWGAEEITLQQLQDAYGTARERAGFVKISLSCEQALRDGLDWVWIDTCCIDKTSTAELSEAINSMFRWYRMATTCYAYLSDVGSLRDLPHSRWFRRGWTLQELVAPRKIHFYGANWVLLGSKATLCAQLSISSGIEELVLRSGQFEHVSIARKMSWAARRQTTRVEDQAYCLLGIFDVNMPLLYGEGKKAFTRLQEEIMKTSDDQSLFAWGLTD